MPPEWAPHERCWMAWPCRAELWGDRMEAARQAYAEVAEAIAQFEPVTMIARPELTARSRCNAARAYRSCRSSTTTAGPATPARPSCVDAQGALAGVDWRFNGWGERHRATPRTPDGRAHLEHLKCRRFDAPDRARGRRGARRRRGNRSGVRRLGPRPEAQSRARRAPRSRSVLADHLGIAKVDLAARGAWWTTRPAGMSTTSPASCGRAWCWRCVSRGHGRPRPRGPGGQPERLRGATRRQGPHARSDRDRRCRRRVPRGRPAPERCPTSISTSPMAAW